MGRASPEYCRKTPISKMGFTQRSSCKAQGLIPRTSQSNKGKYIRSPKYISKSSLFSPGKNKPRTKTGYRDGETAIMTLNNISSMPTSYQKQVVNTMYNHRRLKLPAPVVGALIDQAGTRPNPEFGASLVNRAKYHKYQTSGMRQAMKVYKKWLIEHSSY